MALYRSTEYLFAQDATYTARLTMAVQRAAVAVMAEALIAGHPQQSQKRWALANKALLSTESVLVAFARATVAYAGSAIGAAVDFSYDGHVPVDPTAPTAPETVAINKAANNGVADAQLDAAVAAVWNAIANVLPSD